MDIRRCQYRVSAKAIIEDESGKILLIQEENGLWELPGGGKE
ncbi:MAG: NUDIX domain-containing protein [Patescibacteria group bacterium]